MHRTIVSTIALLVCLAPAAAQAQDGEPDTATLDRAGSLGDAPQPARPLPATFGSIASDFFSNGVAPEGDVPTAVRYTPDGARIVVAHRDSRNLVVFDAATLTFAGEVALSGGPADLAISSSGTRAVTANQFEDTASVVDLVTLTEIAVVPVGDQPGLVRITPNGATAVVGNTVSQDVSVIDVATATETLRIPGAGFAATLSAAFEPGVVTMSFYDLALVDDTTAIAPDSINDEIDFFDLATGAVSSIPSLADPREIAVTPNGATAVVTHFGSVQQITVVDTATQAITKTIPVGQNLWGPITIRPDGSKAVAAILNACVVVDLATNAVSPSLNTATVNALRTTADGNYALGVGFRGPLISYATETIVKELNNVVSTAVGDVAPVGTQGAMAANTFGEDLIVVRTNGAAGFLEAQLTSGAPPEGDRARFVAVSCDAQCAVTSNVLSDTASIVDLQTGATSIVAVGDRPAEVEITPSGTTAVVANLDSPFVSVIDLGTQSVTNVPTSTRNSEVEISPDGQFAYVAVVVADGVWRIDLGTNTVSGPKLTTGQMGSVGYAFQQSSGLTLSHDGATLVACNSFDDTITVIDTAAWSVVATVPVGDFPTRALFSANDGRVFVANRDGDTVTVVNNAGAASATLTTVAVGDSPFEMDLSPDGRTLYVLSTNDDAVGVVDLVTNQMVTTFQLPEAPQGLWLNEDGTRLHVASGTWTASIGPGPATAFNTFGWFTSIDPATGIVTNEIDTGLPPASMVVDDCGTIALVASPLGDGFTRVRLDAAATTTPYGCGVNPAGSLTVLSGLAAPGGAITFGVDNPLGTQPAGSVPLVAISSAPDASFPCGTSIPTWGMSAPGATGELLIDFVPPNPFLFVLGPPWAGPGSPAGVVVVVPANCALVGKSVYVQGALVDPFGTLGITIGLAGALEVVFGT